LLISLGLTEKVLILVSFYGKADR